jgi:hypothetical protein
MYTEEMRVGEFLSEPHVAVVKALLLQFQPTFLDILPLYIVLLAVFPVVLVALRVQPLMVLIPSVLLYALVQATDLSVPAYPPGHTWYFNPLAWQFLFVAGAALGLDGTRRQRFARRGRALLPLAALIVAAAGVVRLSWTIHGVWDPSPGLFLKELWPVNKSNLSPVRLVPFFALAAIVAAGVPATAGFLRSSAAKPLVLCGRHSLEIFCLGILLSALGHFVLSEYDSGVLTQLAVNTTGILALCLTAKLIDWYKDMGRALSPPPVAVPAAGEE